MPLWSRYIPVSSVEDGLEALASAPGPACPIAGGTDLLLELDQGERPAVESLVDVSAVGEMNRLELRSGGLFVGAAVPVGRIAKDEGIRAHGGCLAEACGLIAGPQVREVATLGGNVAHALPAADGAIALVALDAQAEVASAAGRRTLPVLGLFKGVRQSALIADRELLVGFTFPERHPGEACAFARVMRPQGVALPIVNMAVWLRREGEAIAEVRIAVGPAGPTPQRAYEVESFLIGKTLTPELIKEANVVLRGSLRFRSSADRGSAAYRYHLGSVLLAETLQNAWDRAEIREVA